jgi:hypothetical protein
MNMRDNCAFSCNLFAMININMYDTKIFIFDCYKQVFQLTQ